MLKVCHLVQWKITFVPLAHYKYTDMFVSASDYSIKFGQFVTSEKKPHGKIPSTAVMVTEKSYLGVTKFVINLSKYIEDEL